MRNGNQEGNMSPMSAILTFYPTYEEWKQELEEEIDFEKQAFYPTYEEWKQANANIGMNNTFNFLSYL